MLKLLALDPATKTGWAHSNGNSGTWNLGPAEDGQGRRLIRLRAHIHGVHRMFGIDKIYSEAASFGSINPNTQAFHNELRGVIRMVAEEIGASFHEHHPTTIKAFATGNGRADKEQMMAACWKLLGVNPIDDNHADALWILDMAKRGYVPPPSEAKKRKALKKFYKKQPKLFR